MQLTMEWKKVFWNMKTILILAALLLFHAIVLYGYQPSSYYQSEHQKQLYQLLVESENPYDAYDTSYQKIFSEDKMITQSLGTEIELYNSFREQINHQRTYADKLGLIQENARKSSISIFGQRTAFEKANTLKTAKDYAEMNPHSISFVFSEGVETLFTSLTADIVLIVFVVWLIYCLILNEKQCGLFPLIRSCEYGRATLLSTKIVVLVLSLILTILASAATTMVVCQLKYGIFDWDAAIVSFGLFRNTCLLWDVKTAILVFYLMKTISYVLFGLILMLIALKTSSSNSFYLVISVFLMISALCYMALPECVFLEWLKNINIIPYLLVYPILSKYWNLNLFSYPIEQKSVYVIVTLIVIIFLILALYRMFCSNKLSTTWKKQQIHRITIHHMNKGVLMNELYKLLIVHKGLLYIVLLVCMSLYSFSARHVLPEEEVYYRSYMVAMQGEWSEDKQTLIHQEQKRFEELDELLMRKQTEYAAGMIDDEEMSAMNQYYQQQSQSHSAFERVVQNVEMCQSNQYPLVYECGFQSLFDLNGQSNTMVLMLIVCSFTVLLSSSYLSEDYQSGMIHLLKTHYHDDVEVYHLKRMLVGLFVLAAYVFCAYLQYRQVQDVYGVSMWNVSVYGVEGLRNGVDISLLAYYGIAHLIRIFVLFMSIGFISNISCMLKDQNKTLLMASLLFVVPIVLKINDISLLDHFSLNGWMSGYMLLQNGVGFCFMLILGLGMYHLKKKTS